MTKNAKKVKAVALGAALVLSSGLLLTSQILPAVGSFASSENVTAAETPVVSPYTRSIDTGRSAAYDGSVVKKLPDGLKENDEISIVVETKEKGIVSAYNAQRGVSRYADVSSYAASSAAQAITREIEDKNFAAKRLLEKTGVKFTYGSSYDAFFGGFEVVAKAGDFAALSAALEGTDAFAYISEEYAVCETKVVTNDVKVYDTGIFDSSESEYDGTGTVVAVLDTGLDYAHSVFDPELFKGQETFTRDTVQTTINTKGLRAAEMTRGLNAANVYMNVKVPYAYDYADADTDVYPLSEEHGTHVAGVIAGNNVGSKKNKVGDPEIVGVAPNAQLAIMKVFSDTESGARWTWLLAALEDCVRLGVDVINMSLGSSAGFSVETDQRQAYVYDDITNAGISLVVAASNDYNSGFNSEKNGNLDLTTNPDTATVGTPSTYNAALSVASISGVKTPYLKFNDTIMYFTEAYDAASKEKDFVNDILPEGTQEADIEYITIPGVGRIADYTGYEERIKGKIALVSRGDNTFEEKARIAINTMGAAGIIIYNNVSGDITMTVGSINGAVCSISQDNGKLLAAQPSGFIHVSRAQEAGPFMSDFSSWGPTPDLRIKPEITAHGGEILSSVPGQRYDRLSGTSMASPNQAGLTALIRQYVDSKFPNLQPQQRIAYVNQLMMSTADIAYNVNGLPYSVRKQGAGLANLTKATTSPAFIQGFERVDNEHLYDGGSRFTNTTIDKAKIEYGDDPEKTGVYDLKFNIVNALGSGPLTYNVDAIAMTEGVSETRTSKGDQVVTQEGYLLDGATVTVIKVEGNGSQNQNTVTVPTGGTATVTVRIQLGDSDKQYLDQSSDRVDANGNTLYTFANGMYVEGYVTLAPTDASGIALNVPYLAFYGDWTQAPAFDLDYFETNRDELDDSIDLLDKTLADIFPTTPVGGLEDEYISYLGAYAFNQDGSGTKISATRDHIALTNDTTGVNRIYGLYAGLLRGARYFNMSITDTTTGEVIWTKVKEGQRKAFQASPSYAEVDFRVADFGLKNNTQYLFRAEAVLDYGDGGVAHNLRRTFEFPFTVDFSAPVLENVEFYTEYDRTNKKNRLYARFYIYDNHYAQAMQVGQVIPYVGPENFEVALEALSLTPTPIFSEFNSTSVVTYELTDHLEQMRNSTTPNDFLVILYDYAMNEGMYEVSLPDDVKYLYFTEEDSTVTLSPNEVYTLEPQVYPATEWRETVQYVSSNEDVVRIVNGKLLPLAKGDATVSAYAADVTFENGTPSADPLATLTVHVLGEGDEGYVRYDAPTVDAFRITGYTTDKAFYYPTYEDRDISQTGYHTDFSANATMYHLSMFPTEQVTLEYEITEFFPDDTEVRFTSNTPNIATISDNGQITAVAEGTGSVSVSVYVNDKSTFYERTIMITVKNPYERNGPYLTGYRGGGYDWTNPETGEVEHNVVAIPASLEFTDISEYAFSHYDFIPKDPGDPITEEDPYTSKAWYLGENEDVRKVIIPEGVKTIGMYAFAGMKGLEEVVLPTTCNKIAAGAFMGCTNLWKINLDHVQFINENAFGPGTIRDETTHAILGYENVGLYNVDFLGALGGELIGVGNRAFYGTKLTNLVLPATTMSIGSDAFAGTNLIGITVNASKLKLSEGAFADNAQLTSVNINADAIPDSTFENCTKLSSVTLGKDVQSVGVNAFGGCTSLTSFNVASGNEFLTTDQNGKSIAKTSGSEKEIILVAPGVTGTFTDADATSVGEGAFAGTNLTTVSLSKVTKLGDYAFYDSNIRNFTLGALTEIGAYAFAYSNLSAMPGLGTDPSIGNYAFYSTSLRDAVNIPENTAVGEGAFANCPITSLTVGDGATLGASAFAANLRHVLDNEANFGDVFRVQLVAPNARLTTVTLGSNVTVGESAFENQMLLATVTGQPVSVGDYAFYNCEKLTAIDLSLATSVGASAFSGEPIEVLLYSGDITSATEVSLADLSEFFIAGSHAPKLTSVNLTALKETESTPALGAGAFAYVDTLTSVTFGEEVTRVADGAFYGTQLSNITWGGIKQIGAQAFATTVYGTIDSEQKAEDGYFKDPKRIQITSLPASFDSIGAGAFADIADLQENEKAEGLKDRTLASVAFKAGVTIGDGAFEYGKAIKTITGLEGATSIGASAFANASLTDTLNLSAATYIGEYAFLNNSGVEHVTLGSNLTGLGDNPFAGCSLQKFGKTQEIKFNGKKVGEETAYTFQISDTVKVIDGALYCKMASGNYVLITYPIADTAREFTVANGDYTFTKVDAEGNESTYTERVKVGRIAAGAFMGSQNLVSVELSLYVSAIGDRAFYGAKKLGIVTFKSVQAPALEEVYDEDYFKLGAAYAPFFSDEDITEEQIERYMVEKLPVNEAYKTWAPVIFYGATFQDRIGSNDIGNIVMVRPKNGTGYDSFIMRQYFSQVLDGAAAPRQLTLQVIDAIDALPASITLNDKTAVEAARALYNQITETEQQALVTNYEKLTSAENTIKFLEGGAEPTTPEEPTPETQNDIVKIVLAIFVGVFGVAAIAFATAWAVTLAKRNQTEEEEISEDADETAASDETTSDETAASDETTSDEATSDETTSDETEASEEPLETPEEPEETDGNDNTGDGE